MYHKKKDFLSCLGNFGYKIWFAHLWQHEESEFKNYRNITEKTEKNFSSHIFFLKTKFSRIMSKCTDFAGCSKRDFLLF